MEPIQAFMLVTEIANNFAEGFRLDEREELERNRAREAVEIMDRIKNSALPVARFDCMVSVEKIGPKSKVGLGDFTICGTTISGIKNGLIGLSMEPLTVYVRLWERIKEGSEMLTGYQGETKTLKFRNFIGSLDQFFPERHSHQAIVNNAS